jgi:hypothetical protein
MILPVYWFTWGEHIAARSGCARAFVRRSRPVLRQRHRPTMIRTGNGGAFCLFCLLSRSSSGTRCGFRRISTLSSSSSWQSSPLSHTVRPIRTENGCCTSSASCHHHQNRNPKYRSFSRAKTCAQRRPFSSSTVISYKNTDEEEYECNDNDDDGGSSLSSASSLFRVTSNYEPAGDQPEAIAQLIEQVREGERFSVLRGMTGTGAFLVSVRGRACVFLVIRF